MSLTARASLIAALSLNLTTSAVAADTVRLSSLAAASGYTYAWLASENGVSLQRPGVVIILHAGYPVYEVNASPVQADRAPVFERGDLTVSPALAQRLRRIAIAHPQPHLAPEAPALFDPPTDSLQASRPGMLTISARQLPGQEALSLQGTAPAGIPINITLTAELSKDLPILVLSRITVISGADGSYSAVVGIGQNPHRGTAIVATATSLPGVSSAAAQIIVDAPNARLHSILDEFPPK